MMRIDRTRCGMLLLAAALLLPSSGLAAEPEAAPDREVVVGDAIERTGKVIAINPDERLVVIEGEAGREIFLKVPAAAANFDQISVGDVVVAKYVEALALAIGPVADAEPGVTATEAVSMAPPGETPGAVAVEQVQLRAVVKSVDTKARTVTLDVPSGGQRTLKVREGVDLTKAAVGEQVSVTYTRALAVSVMPPGE